MREGGSALFLFSTFPETETRPGNRDAVHNFRLRLYMETLDA